MKPYREQALKLLPPLCVRCTREFPASRLRELTVHHKDGNHDNNPKDGSNWELLCIYCHENEHRRVLDAQAQSLVVFLQPPAPATNRATPPNASASKTPEVSPDFFACIASTR